jgi:HSP20 family molecular chaperone IbpA
MLTKEEYSGFSCSFFQTGDMREYTMECLRRRFERFTILPVLIDGSEMTTSYEHGIPTIIIPKADKQQ